MIGAFPDLVIPDLVNLSGVADTYIVLWRCRRRHIRRLVLGGIRAGQLKTWEPRQLPFVWLHETSTFRVIDPFFSFGARLVRIVVLSAAYSISSLGLCMSNPCFAERLSFINIMI
jgi:hypothetical protein